MGEDIGDENRLLVAGRWVLATGPRRQIAEDGSPRHQARHGNKSPRALGRPLRALRYKRLPQRNSRQFVLVRIADHPPHSGQRGQFFRSPLCVASGHDDFSCRIFPVHAANGGPRILVGRSGHGTGVENYNFRLVRCKSAFQATFLELAF